MKAMVLEQVGQPLRAVDWVQPALGVGELRLRIEACAVCRTDLHVVDGDLPNPKLPLIPGHEIVGIVDAVGEGSRPSRLGRRVGVPWLGHTCGSCSHIARAAQRTCAISRSSPVTPATAALRPTPWPTPPMRSTSIQMPIPYRWHPFSVPD